LPSLHRAVCSLSLLGPEVSGYRAASSAADERGAGSPAPPSQIQVLHLHSASRLSPQPPSCDPPRLQERHHIPVRRS
jgi:hypothetical protein